LRRDDLFGVYCTKAKNRREKRLTLISGEGGEKKNRRLEDLIQHKEYVPYSEAGKGGWWKYVPKLANQRGKKAEKTGNIGGSDCRISYQRKANNLPGGRKFTRKERNNDHGKKVMVE